MAEASELESSEEPSTTLYVLVPPSALFAAHWSFFVPDLLSYDAVSRRYEESKRGRRIHVTGDRLHGFALEIIRDYDITKDRAVGSRKFAVALLPRHCLRQADDAGSDRSTCKRKDEDEGGGYVDNNPVDELERICTQVEAPGPSLNKASESAPGKRMRSEVRDCQWWIKQVVRALLKKGILSGLSMESGDDTVKRVEDTVASLPVH